MVNRVLLERILSDIKTNVKELRDANDINWDIYRTDVRARRFVEGDWIFQFHQETENK